MGLCRRCGGSGAIRNPRFNHKDPDHKAAGIPGWVGCPACKQAGLTIPDHERLGPDSDIDAMLFPELQPTYTSIRAEALLDRITGSTPMARFMNMGLRGNTFIDDAALDSLNDTPFEW